MQPIRPWPIARRGRASPPSGAPIPRFDPDQFLQGARAAFAMIVEAYAKGDKAALRPLLADEVFAQFAGAIDAPRAGGPHPVDRAGRDPERPSWSRPAWSAAGPA